jgi:hypothetical protein
VTLISNNINIAVRAFFPGPYCKWWVTSLRKRSSGIEAALQYILPVIKRYGKVDGILGFSQGAELVQALDSLAAAREIKQSWRFSVIMSAGKSTNAPSLGPRPIEINIPSIHVYGSESEERISQTIRVKYVNRKHKIGHVWGHIVPLQTEFTKPFSQAMRACLE